MRVFHREENNRKLLNHPSAVHQIADNEFDLPQASDSFVGRVRLRWEIRQEEKMRFIKEKGECHGTDA
jgi:hypothetical protein